MNQGSNLGMNRKDRVVKRIAAWSISLLYRRFEVRQAPRLTESGPELANASHFGGFSDPLILAHAMDRLPRFVARDIIWKNPVARFIMNLVGAIPVHKPEDGGGSSNDQMFATAYERLGDEELITIFPEGITVDDPSIARIKTGSARIALGARSAGVEGIRIISAGIHYENKASLRSDVFVDIGWPLDLDATLDEWGVPPEAATADNRELVQRLTEEMELRLRLAAPDFEDWRTARSLSEAAAISLRTGRRKDVVGHADRERMARLLDAADEERRTGVVDAVESYQRELDGVGVSDAVLVSELNDARKFSWFLLRTLVVGLLLLPFAIVGLVVNAIPMAIVWLVGRLRVSDAMMATVKPMAALFVFLLTWGAWVGWAWLQISPAGAAAAALLMPVYLFALIAWWERVELVAIALRGLGRSFKVSKIHEELMTQRAAVIEAVVQAL